MNVYWFQDSKTGHLKQVQALLDQLKKETELSLTTIKHSDQESFQKCSLGGINLMVKQYL